MKTIYVVQFCVQYEGSEIHEIFSSLESAIQYTEQQVELHNLGKIKDDRVDLLIKDSDHAYVWASYSEWYKITKYELKD